MINYLIQETYPLFHYSSSPAVSPKCHVKVGISTPADIVVKEPLIPEILRRLSLTQSLLPTLSPCCSRTLQPLRLACMLLLHHIGISFESKCLTHQLPQQAQHQHFPGSLASDLFTNIRLDLHTLNHSGIPCRRRCERQALGSGFRLPDRTRYRRWNCWTVHGTNRTRTYMVPRKKMG